MNPILRLFLFFAVVLLSVGLCSAQNLEGSFSIVWKDAKITQAALKGPNFGKIIIIESQGLTMHCIRKEDKLMCDYLHEKTGKPKNEPSLFNVDLETDEYLFVSNESNTTRLHINKKEGTALMTSNVFFPDKLDYFGVKMIVGNIVR